MTTTFEFETPVDIANRALQHLGARRITTFTDDSKNATECQFVYDKLRQAELNRNTWRFATRSVVLRPLSSQSFIFQPPAWQATSYYQVSDIVSYDGLNWISDTAFNMGNIPGVVSDGWDIYYGPLSMEPALPIATPATTFSTGELVYELDATGFPNVFVARTMGASGDPNAAAAYSSATTYSRGDMVTYSGTAYISMLSQNLNNTPGATALALWAAGTTYAAAAQVITPDGVIYTSQLNGNVGNNPATDSGTNWLGASSIPYVQYWLAWPYLNWAPGWFAFGQTINSAQRMGQAVPIDLLWPLNSGPSTEVQTNNVFRLPNGFLRKAPLDPKGGLFSYLGGPSHNYPDDYVFEGDYVISRRSDPMVFRFVTDFVNVPKMDPMFCEGLSARMAYELCETITQSTEKKAEILKAYNGFMREARLINAIITGAVGPAEDDFISCRM